MASLTKDAILAATDLPVESVFVPEWSGSVLVRGLTAAERDDYEQELMAARGEDRKAKIANLRGLLVVRCVVNEQGERVFANADAEAVGKRSAKAMERIVDVAQRLSGIGAKELAEIEKNSASAPT